MTSGRRPTDYVERWADRRALPKNPRKKRGEAWTDAQDEFLKTACQTRKSFGVIYVEYNAQFPGAYKSRNAIIGRANRQGYTGTKPQSGPQAQHMRKIQRNRVVKATPGKRAPRKVKELVPVVFKASLRDDNAPIVRRSHPHMLRKTPEEIAKARKGYLPPIIEEAPLTSVVMGQTADDCCKWPTSEDVLCMEVCGAPAEYGAYCERHARVAYREMPTRRRNNHYARKGNLDDECRVKQRDARILEELNVVAETPSIEAPLLEYKPEGVKDHE